MTAAVEPTPASRPVLKRIIIAGLLRSLRGAGVYGLSIVRQLIPVEPDEVFNVVAQIESEERPVQVEAFLPTTGPNARYSAILYLHGVEGTDRYPAVHARSCRWLADQDYAVFFVHYFVSVDYNDLGHLREDDSLDTDLISHRCWEDARRWCDAVESVVTEVARRPDVDAQRIAMDGISLGGFISLEVADEALRQRQVPDLCAVLANWSAQFEITNCRIGFPPTLPIPGELDEVVPRRNAKCSVEAIRAVGSEAEWFVVPGAPHPAESAESEFRTLEFLKRRLKVLATAHRLTFVFLAALETIVEYSKESSA